MVTEFVEFLNSFRLELSREEVKCIFFNTTFRSSTFLDRNETLQRILSMDVDKLRGYYK